MAAGRPDAALDQVAHIELGTIWSARLVVFLNCIADVRAMTPSRDGIPSCPTERSVLRSCPSPTRYPGPDLRSGSRTAAQPAWIARSARGAENPREARAGIQMPRGFRPKRQRASRRPPGATLASVAEARPSGQAFLTLRERAKADGALHRSLHALTSDRQTARSEVPASYTVVTSSRICRISS